MLKCQRFWWNTTTHTYAVSMSDEGIVSNLHSLTPGLHMSRQLPSVVLCMFVWHFSIKNLNKFLEFWKDDIIAPVPREKKEHK